MTDALTIDELGDNARMIIEYLRRKSVDAQGAAGVRALAAMRAEGDRHTRKWTASVRAGTGVDLGALLADDDLVDLIAIRSGEYNALIRKLSEDVLHTIERKTLGAIFEGKGNREVQQEIEAATSMGAKRAKLIARDQASKLNGAMNEFRQRQAGVTHYTWRTVLDGRERATHHDRNGKVFSWDNPPGDGHPGRAINCRCRASAILIDDEDDAASVIEETEGADDLDDLSDRLTAASSVMRGDTLIKSREALLIQQAEIAATLKSFKGVKGAITEAEADNLFEAVFGFPSEGQDLARMAGLGFLGDLKSRKALLVAAIEARLRVASEYAQHAAETAEH